jgi:23S rRNA (guanosine2251-2'-O)-methyltransferase
VNQAVVTNLNREIEYLQSQGFWVYGAAIGGESLHATVFPKRTALVLGSEGRGISQLTEKLCDHIVAIPTTGNIDSLNVSVAAGIFLYEIRRQQA